VTRGIDIRHVILRVDLCNFSGCPEVDQLRVSDFGLAEKAADKSSVATLLKQVSHYFHPDSIPQGGGAARGRLRYPSSPERIAEGGAVVVDARLAFGLPSLAAVSVVAAHLVVEVMQGGGGTQFSLCDRVLASPDHSQLSGHLHDPMRASWVTPARLH